MKDVPTYSYACRTCQHGFDIQQAFSDESLTTCPECGGSLRKIYSAVGVVFKGSGFYRNDSRSTSKSSTASETKDAPPAKEAKPAKENASSASKSSDSASKPANSASTAK